jgi:glycosyltransferase involved in cell wall biosynthesis
LNTKVVLTIIGPPEKAKDEIIAYALSDNIKCNFIGIAGQNEVYAQMQIADIFCVPSLQEGLGVANIEAMAHGCTIISTNTGGIPEVLDYGKNGWLVEPNSVESLYEGFQAYFNQPELRTQKKHNAVQFIEKFKLSTILDAFIQQIEKA